MNSSNRPGPRNQDVRLPVPPDLPDDSLPLLQPSSLLQLLGRGENVQAPQSAVRLAAAVTQRTHCHFRDLRIHRPLLSYTLLLFFLILLLFTGLLELSPRWRRRWFSVAASPASDAGHQEAQRHEKPEADAHHEVEGKALWIGCTRRGKKNEFTEIKALKSGFIKLFFIFCHLYTVRVVDAHIKDSESFKYSDQCMLK